MVTVGIFELLFGAPLMGYMGDRFGRKRAVLIGLCAFGGFTLIAMAARSLSYSVVRRFMTRIGLGGVIPNASAFTAKIAPGYAAERPREAPAHRAEIASPAVQPAAGDGNDMRALRPQHAGASLGWETVATREVTVFQQPTWTKS